MSRKKLWLALTLAGALALQSCRPKEAKDLEQYLRERRQAGISEAAEANLKTLADVEAGRIIISYEKEPEGYSVQYNAAYCPLPGANLKEIERIEAPLLKASAAQFEILKKIADKDRSGFVSTSEGAAVANLVNFAREATYVTEREGRDAQKVARLMEMDPARFNRMLQAYRDLLRRSAGRDPKMRDVPL